MSSSQLVEEVFLQGFLLYGGKSLREAFNHHVLLSTLQV